MVLELIIALNFKKPVFSRLSRSRTQKKSDTQEATVCAREGCLRCDLWMKHTTSFREAASL